MRSGPGPGARRGARGDIGIIATRDYLLRAIRAFQDGAQPPHIVTDPAENDMTHIDTVHGVFPTSEGWREHWPYLTGLGPASGKGTTNGKGPTNRKVGAVR